MMFHGNHWGMRASAARLLLAPVVAGFLAGAAVGQAPARGQPPAAAPATNPQELLKQGRAALKAGQFDRASDLARRADAVNPAGRWGLFDDTPESLEKDIAAGRTKANKSEADRLAKAARDLYGKPARTAGERIANLDQAHALADKAMTLAGPADFFDDLFGGDRPEKLKKDIDTARAAVRKANPTLAAAPPAGGMAGKVVSSGITPASATGRPSDLAQAKPASAMLPPPVLPPLTTPADIKAATELVAKGREMLAAGNFADAKALAAKAVAIDAPTANADTLLRDVTTAGKAKVDQLVRDAAQATQARDFSKAEAALNEAKTVAAGLGFQSKPLDDQLTQIRTLAAGVTPVLPTPAPVPSTATALIVPELPPITPPSVPTVPSLPTVAAVPTLPDVPPMAVPTPPMPQPPVVAAAPIPPMPKMDAPALPTLGLPNPATLAGPPVETPAVPAMPEVPAVPAMPEVAAPPPPSNVLTGEQLLNQARTSLRSADLSMAKTLAVQAFNAPGANKLEVSALLREIDAEAAVRSRQEASAAFKNAVQAISQNQFDQAAATLRLIDPDELPTDLKAQYEPTLAKANAELVKVRPSAAVAVTPPTPSATTPPSEGPADQVKAMTDIEYTKLRSEGLEVESKAREAFNRGETDLAIQSATDFLNKVKQSSLSTSRQELLSSSMERRLNAMRIMKRQTDFYASEAKGKIAARDRVVGKQLAEQQKQDDLRKKSGELTELMAKKKFRDAKELALQMKNLDPENPTLEAMYEMAKRQHRVDTEQRLKSSNEELTYKLLSETGDLGPTPTNEMPLIVDPIAAAKARARGNGELFSRPMTSAEREIEVKLERPVSVEFKNTPLREVLMKLKDEAKLNLTIDEASIADAQINLDTVTVTDELQDLSLRNVLEIVLEKARLKHVIESNVVKVTTEKRAQGKLIAKTFPVMELVTPVPDFALAPHQSLSKALAATNPGATPAWSPPNGGQSTYMPNGGLAGGELTSGRLPGAPAGGELDGTTDNLANPLADSATLAKNGRSNHSAQLMRLVTAIVKPHSWQEGGGAGTIKYYDIGGALVVNQTADVIGEVQQLLESLRRLQEVSVSVEIRVVSLSESFFERIGVDFAMNIKTQNTKNFERSLTTGQFRPEPFINDINTTGVTVGWNPTAGGFTPDLDFPVRTNSFGLGIPPFGGYPGPGNGGLGLGLAFLNDIQVFMFMEAAAGDRRVNIMQAPKITLFNGQTSTVFVSDFAFFTTGLQVINVGGQFVYLPQNTPLPIGNSPAPPGVQAGQALPGVTVTVQAIVSADRRFVRLNLAPTLTSLTSATVPLFPVTAFITPVFEGGSQGVPIPFTQFFQQPSISEINVQTTVAVPDGGTVVLGGLKTLAEGRNEFGPPVLSQIPYVNRLFRNQGIGRETKHVMIMVTPRIIIQSEEELNQTGGGVGFGIAQ